MSAEQPTHDTVLRLYAMAHSAQWSDHLAGVMAHEIDLLVDVQVQAAAAEEHARLLTPMACGHPRACAKSERLPRGIADGAFGFVLLPVSVVVGCVVCGAKAEGRA